MAEHAAVNRRVVGSSPTRGARPRKNFGAFSFMPHSVYILKSSLVCKYYIGSSANPIRRLEFHNTVEKGFTSRYRPWEIVFTIEYKTKEEAMAAERKIKSWKSRIMIERLLHGEIKI
ncbi:MAG: hypothetical protein FD178_1651 [Ignavibacteria bacterium]|nr:MAG: hypothetical protein FD178_1651 [Ignavibacteria bacterium]